MRILHILPQLSGGGAERQFGYLVPELVRLGHDINVAYSTEGPGKVELSGVVLHRLQSRSNFDPYLLWQLIRLTRTIRPDIIHTWIVQMDILGGITAKINRLPWILREPCSPKAYSSTWKHFLRVKLGSTANGVVSNSRDGDEYWKNRLPTKRRYIVANGLPQNEIDRIVDVLPAELSEQTAPIVLYVGRLLEAQKRVEAFIEALAWVRQKCEVFGVICGEGPQRAELEKLRHNLGMDMAVYFTGYLPTASVWALMKKASVFVSLSAYEGCPNTVMEAMACSCPLVLSDIAAHRELLDESCALFVDPCNIQQTAAAIMRALNNAGESKNRALIAKQKTQKWSISEMVKKYERVYEEVIANY